MGNKSLKAARQAYNRSKSTKYRIDVDTGEKVKKKKKQNVKSHYGQTDQKNKKITGTDAKKALDKNKTGKSEVKSHFGQVESKTRNTTANATQTVKNVIESNVSASKKNKSGAVGGHFGQVTQEKINKSEERGKKKFGVGTYSTANAKKAKEKQEQGQQAYEESTKKKVQTVTDEQLKAEQKKEADRAARATRFYQQKERISGELSEEEADAEVKKAKKEARKAVKEGHTLEYITGTRDNEYVQRIANSSQFANTKVKDVEATDKAKRQARFYAQYMVRNGAWTQDEANDYVKNAGKDLYTSQGNQILDKLGGKGTAEDVGTQSVGKIADSPFFAGALQGSSYGDITRGVGKYNQQAAELLDKTTNSGAFMGGYMVGQGAQFMLGGTAKMTDALVRGVAKNGMTRGALNVGLRKGAADVMFEAPLNTLDAIKMSTDANGNFDKKAFFKMMALNTGLSGGIGSVIGGVGAKMTKNDVRKFAEFSEKMHKGIDLTPEELDAYGRIQKKMDDALESGNRVNADYVNSGKADAVLGKADKDEYMSLLGKKQAGNITQQENVRLSSYENIIRQNYDEAQNTYAKILADAASGVKKNIEAVKQAADFFERSGDEAKAEEADAILKNTTKEQQFDIIKKTNPKDDSLGDHTWIESADDIKTYDEVFTGEDFTPDFTAKQAKEALDSGEITVYSSKPIEDGTFVTPSKMEAQNYAGSGKVYEQKLKTDDIAWIDEGQGQVAKVSETPSHLNPNYKARVTSLDGKEPYTGKIPTQQSEKISNVNIPMKTVNDADDKLKSLGAASKIKSWLKGYLPDGGIDVRVIGVEYGDNPYYLHVGKGSAGKLVNEGVDGIRAAVFENIEDVVRDSNFVGSAKFDQHTVKEKNVIRYDYFESLIKVDGEDYGVTIQAEVVRGANNFRTHNVTKIEVEPQVADAGRKPAAENATSTSINSITHNSKKGNGKIADTPKQEESVKAKTKAEDSKELKETPKTEVDKLSENKYASDEVKTALKDIEKAGIYKEAAEKEAKKFNALDKKIAAQTKHIENAKKKEYPTVAEKNAHIAELEEELKDLKNRQAKVAGQIEQYGKMKPVDNTKTAGEQIRELHGERKVNKEVKTPQNLKNEDSWIKDKWNSVRRLWEDSLIDVENVAKKSGDKTLREEILTAANRVRNSMHVANNWITKGRKSFNNKVGGKALDDIFTKDLIENEAKYADFQEYLVMKHVPARHAKGTDIYADISPALANKRVAELEDQYGKELTDWSNDVYDYLKDLQQYRVDSGMLSKEAAEQFAKDYPFYVPTNRVNDETINFFTGGSSNGIRTAKGGESQVLDMYSQIYTATNKTIHAAEENQMLNLYFRAKGVPKEELMQYKNDDLEHAVINATVNKKTGDSKVSFFIDGKPVDVPCSHQLALGIRELDGLEFERLMKAAKVATLYGKPFKALVTDWNLVFGVRNGMRDIQQAAVNSKDTRYFGSSLGAAAHAIANDDNPYRKLYSSMGGEQAQLVSYDAVAKQMGLEKSGKIDKIHEGVQDWVDAEIKGKNINPIHYIEGINGAIEMMPRMCEFVGTLRKQADKMLKEQGSSLKKLRKEIIAEVEGLEKTSNKIGQTEISAEVENRLAQRVIDMVGKDTIDSAMRNANDITLNFGRSGVLGRALNMGFVPYLNPSIQGLSKLVRLFTEAGGEGGWKALASLGMKIGAFNVSLAAWNEIALRNNEDYQNLNTRDKDNNFFIPYGDGKFIKIPKPRENAVLIEPVEYGLRYFFDKSEYAYFDWDKLTLQSDSLWDKIPLTDEGKQSFKTAIDNIGVINPLTSNMFSPIHQTLNNKTWYGGSIESAYEQSKDENGNYNVPVKDRYDTGTSMVAIALGKTKGAQALNLSPKKIDNILDSYLGMIYDLGISQTTEEAKTRGNYFVRTVASQFTKDSVFSNKLSTKAWEKTDGMSEKQLNDYKSTYMYDTYKYDDAKEMITADKNMTNAQKMEAKRALQIQKNKLNREAIDGKPNTSNPLVDISKYLGVNKTLNHFLPKSKDGDSENWADYYKKYKTEKGYKDLTPKQKEKQGQKFLDVYSLAVKGQLKADPKKYHDSPSWGMTGVAAAQLATQGKLKEKDATTIMKSCGVYESQTATYYNYAEHGGNVSRYAVTVKNNDSAKNLAEELGVTTKGEGSVWTNKYDKSKGIKGGVYSMSLATGKAQFKDRAYYISNPSDENMLIKMNAARGYSSKYGHTTEQLIKLGKKADADGNTYLKDDEIIAACKTIRKGKATNEEMSMAYILLGGKPSKNPFGAIGDYSLDGDTGIQPVDDEKGGGGGHGRRRRRRGGGRGGSSKGTVPTTDTGAIKGKVTDPFRTSNGTSKSNLNDAYRKKAKKLRQQMHK